MNKKAQDRKNRLLPDGKPRYVRIYDNGGCEAPEGSSDRYTVVFTGNYKKGKPPFFYHLFMSENPSDPQGIGISDALNQPIDTEVMFKKTGYFFPPKIGQKHPTLGRRIAFDDLPEPCKRSVLADYLDIWEIKT